MIARGRDNGFGIDLPLLYWTERHHLTIFNSPPERLTQMMAVTELTSTVTRYISSTTIRNHRSITRCCDLVEWDVTPPKFYLSSGANLTTVRIKEKKPKKTIEQIWHLFIRVTDFATGNLLLTQKQFTISVIKLMKLINWEIVLPTKAYWQLPRASEF